MTQNQKKLYVSNPDAEIFVKLEEFLKREGKTFSGWVAENARKYVSEREPAEKEPVEIRLCKHPKHVGQPCTPSICAQLDRIRDYGSAAQEKMFKQYWEHCIFAEDANLT